jgi:hypothetical protein
MLNPIIETAIGMVFVYLLLSMVCSVVQEWIAAMLALRGKTLEEGVKNILADDSALAERIYDDPLVKSLARTSWWNKLWRMKARPAYIPSQLFAKAFLRQANVTVDANNLPQLPATAKAANKPINQETLDLLTTLKTYAPGDVDKLTSSVEQWYDDAMDRVSGWYKRRSQLIILFIGAALAVGLNADSVMLANVFWQDPTLRAATANAATEYVQTHQAQVDKLRNRQLSQQYPSTVQSLTPTEKPTPEAQFNVATQDLSDTIGDVQSQLTKTNIPLGWSCKAPPTTPSNSTTGKAAASTKPTPASQTSTASKAEMTCVWNQKPSTSALLLWKILGLLATTLAISQGAPFWFDLLQKIVNLRLAGNAPDQKTKK